MKKKKNHYFIRSLKYLKPYKGLVSIIIVGLLLASIFSAVKPYFTERLLNSFTLNNSEQMLIYAILVLIMEIGTYISLISSWGFFSAKLQHKVTRNIRYNLTQSAMRLKTKNYDKYGSGKLIQVITNDTASLSSTYTNIIDVSSTVCSKLAILIYIFITNFYLGLYCLLEIVIIAFLNTYRMKVRYRDYKKYKKDLDSNTGLVNEVIIGSREVKNYNIQDNILNKVDDTLEKIQKSGTNFGNKQYISWRLINCVESILIFAFIPLCLLMIKHGLVTFSVAFTVFVFKNTLTESIRWIITTLEEVKDGELYASRIFNIIDGYYEGFEEFPETTLGKLDKKVNIEIKDLNFSYIENKEVLKDFNLFIKQGAKIALVGESGCGKSTILKLLNKSYDVKPNQIKIAGVDICDFSRNDLRNLVTIVPQDPYIFNFSIRDNLKIIKPDATEKELISVCKKAQIYDFINSLVDGFDTILGENGTILSGGQKQRLAIARALLKDSPILIFDEATSALDNENQGKIKKVIDGIGKNKTVIIVAHRLSTIVDADQIYYIKNGSIVANGTHAELLKTYPDYKNLYKQEI